MIPTTMVKAKKSKNYQTGKHSIKKRVLFNTQTKSEYVTLYEQALQKNMLIELFLTKLIV